MPPPLCYRLLENPSGKLLPAPSKVIDAAQRLFIEADRRTEHIRLWHDAALSLRRSGNLCVPWRFRLLIGLRPHMRTTLVGFFAVVSMVPPLVLLPILFMVIELIESPKVL